VVATRLLVGVSLLGVVTARAEPFAIAVDAGPRFAFTGGVLGRINVSGSYRWDRIEASVDLAVGVGRHTQTIEQSIGAGVRFFPGAASWELVLGWRFGHAWIRDDIAREPLGLSTFKAEFVPRIAFRRGAYEVRFAPVVAGGYLGQTWLLTVGPELGIARRF
jgi:hypothetical protein